MALRDPIYPFGSVGLFLDAPPSVLYANPKRRELALGFTPEEIDCKFVGLLKDHAAHIVPQRSRAYLIVEVDENYPFRTLTVGVG